MDLKSRIESAFPPGRAAGAFFLSIALWGIASGCFQAVMNNFLADVHNFTEYDRGWLEFFREMPGLLLVFMLAALHKAEAAVDRFAHAGCVEHPYRTVCRAFQNQPGKRTANGEISPLRMSHYHCHPDTVIAVGQPAAGTGNHAIVITTPEFAEIDQRQNIISSYRNTDRRHHSHH